jgi:phosphoglycerate dehydrogenase-like enzyme
MPAMNKNKKIVYLGPSEGLDAIMEVCPPDWTIAPVSAKTEEVAKGIEDAIGLVDASMKVQLDHLVVGSSQSLRIISTATTGSDHIDIDFAESRGILVRTLREDRELLQELTPAAELSWALVLTLARRVTEAVEHVRSREWNRENFPGVMLNKKTLGVVGCGRIGSWVARYGVAFGMRVVGYDPKVEKWPDHIEPVSLERLMSEADVISVHVHLTRETDGMIDRSLLESVKSGAIIINTSRANIVDELALLDGLKCGRIGGVGLDVLSGEPDIQDHPLVEYSRANSNLIITPHCGGYSPDAVRVVCKRAAEKIFDVYVDGSFSREVC